MFNDSNVAPSPLFLMSKMALQISMGSGTTRHRHVAAQIIVALENQLLVQFSPHEDFTKCDGVLIPPNVTHHIAGPGPLALMIWLDPATIESRAIRVLSASKMVPLHHIQSKLTFEKLKQMSVGLRKSSDAEQIIKTVTRFLLPECKAVNPLDSRISTALAGLYNLSPLDQPYPLARLAEDVNLSEGRFRHLFREELGVPFQQYWIGHRLLTAIRQMERTGSLTEVSQNAGFSDLPHFSRAFRTSFGISPSFAQKDSRFVQASPPES